MGEVRITVQIHGADELQDDLDRALELRIRKRPGACPRCRANDDPAKVPVHPNCHCVVELVNAD